jgi:hypothetical protein
MKGDISMETFLLKQFFLDMLNLSYEAVRPGWGNPCSYLLERLMLRQEPFLNKIVGDYTNSSHEMRLNGAGLKLWWTVHREGVDARFTCHIGGDQAREYPFFVDRVEKLILKYKFNRR